MKLYRIGNFLYQKNIPILPKLFSLANRLIFGCWLPSSATIGRRVKLGYWGIGIVIHSDAVIGNDCLIGQNVTIGRNKKIDGVPVIGNNVYIAAGSVVVGNISIGDGVVIGALSFVNRSVPPGKIVVGCPAKIIGDADLEEIRQITG